MGNLPFEGLRIADFGWIFAVPHATAWLGSLGADVIRVESMLAPDIVRFLSGTDGVVGVNRSGAFHSINMSRRSLTLNLGHPEGAAIARRLVKASDIVTENYTVGNMAKFGLGYESLRQLKPEIIMLSGTPLGQTGPYARTVGWGPTTQAFAGMCHLTGYPGEFPCGIGGTWPDFEIGVAMVFAILAALHYRDRTGQGQYIDLSMAEMVTSMLPEAMMDFFLNGRDAVPVGNRDDAMAPHGVFPCIGDDQWIAIATIDDAEFAVLCDVLGAPALAADARYARVDARLANVDTLEREIASHSRRFARDNLVERLRARNLTTGPVYRTHDLMDDSAFRQSGMLVKLDHIESGNRVVPGLPVRFSAMTPDYAPAPGIGQHTDEILSGLLGYSAEEILSLKELKAVV